MSPPPPPRPPAPCPLTPTKLGLTAPTPFSPQTNTPSPHHNGPALLVVLVNAHCQHIITRLDACVVERQERSWRGLDGADEGADVGGVATGCIHSIAHHVDRCSCTSNTLLGVCIVLDAVHYMCGGCAAADNDTDRWDCCALCWVQYTACVILCSGRSPDAKDHTCAAMQPTQCTTKTHRHPKHSNTGHHRTQCTTKHTGYRGHSNTAQHPL